jgi:WD40 repeat protein
VIAFEDPELGMGLHSGFAQIWNGTTGAKVGSVMHLEGHALFASFGPNGKQIVTGHQILRENGYARIWNAQTGKPLTDAG